MNAPFRFLHSGDLHLGRRFGNLPEEVRSRLVEARHQILHRLAEAARAQGACDVFLAGAGTDGALLNDFNRTGQCAGTQQQGQVVVAMALLNKPPAVGPLLPFLPLPWILRCGCYSIVTSPFGFVRPGWLASLLQFWSESTIVRKIIL